MDERVGFIGLGTMGAPMSRCLIRAGYRVVFWARRPEVISEFRTLGAEAVASPREVAQRTTKVITVLPDSSVIEEVVLGPSGLVGGFAAGSTLIDMSSALPTSTRRIAKTLAGSGVHMIDAPVSGGTLGATDGTLTIMVGGDEEIYRACRPLLAVMGNNIFHIGTIGAGHTLKAINNMMAAVNFLAGCEGLVLGVKAGIDPQVLVDVVKTGSGQSFVFDAKVRRYVLADNYKPGFMTDLMYKDVAIAMTLAAELGTSVRSGALALEALGEARTHGMGRLDFSCIVKQLEERAGVVVRPNPPAAAVPA